MSEEKLESSLELAPYAVCAGSISVDSAESLAEEVHLQRSHWTNRNGLFWTLGPSAYLDDPLDYAVRTRMETEYMSKTFGKWYQEVGDVLERFVHGRIVQQPSAAPLGFHIFQKTDAKPSIHLDLPFQRVFWPEPFSDPFSFTVLLESPKSGAGLDVWNRPLNEVGESDPDYHYPYKVGDVIVHSGLSPHAVSSRYPLEDGEFRITLQGHGARLLASGCIAVYF